MRGSLQAPARTLALLACLGAASCEATPPKEPDRTAFLAHMPRSILVLPPLDETPEADAPYGWLGTVTRPLAERGYYVFPVAVVDAMMKENGLPTPGEMHQVSLSKLGEIFGADAVLYADLKEWGTSYHVLESQTKVTVQARLVDVKSGTEIWRGENTVVRGSNDGGQGNLASALAGALAHQIFETAADSTPEVASAANWGLIHSYQGLLLGPHHPGFDADQEERRKAAAAPVEK